MTGLVGSIVGEVSALPSSSGSTLTDTGLGYDMAIGGLGFKLKISDENKYERATAQFKKDQFDNSTEYGDQSLLGYWTRGQFSFHKGAGITYYDTADGETVLNRYRAGEGVDPFTPGEVTLDPEWTQTTTTASFTDLRWAGSGNGYIAFLDGNTLKYASSLTGALSTYSPTYGTSAYTYMAAGPLCVYGTRQGVSTKNIDRIRLSPAGIGAGTVESLYHHIEHFRGIFYAKDRLWVVDAAGVWYQLAPNPTGATPINLSAGDIVFTAGDTYEATTFPGDPTWCLVDTPGPVLISNGGKIYAISIGADGVVPSLSGPIQVAELPTGERIRGMTYHLGFLGLATSAGIRIAVVSESGTVTYGPLLTRWADAPLGLTIGTRGNSLLIPGGGALYEVDISQQVGDTLEFAWSLRSNPFTGTPALYGSYTFNGTTVCTWASTYAKHEGSNLASSGYLTTGYHRFGTLEPKKFHTVKMRVSGTGGTVAIYKVLSDGSEISLLTIDVSTSTGEDQITLGMDAPTELVGLKFVLTRSAGDATVGPTLLGYQLRALPAPKRQRLIRFPLMLMDVERRGVTRATGYEGSAWDRLEALEDMEASSGVFQFQDFRTGESGTCQIESVEHAGSTPPGKDSNGFGGVVNLTIRKL